jgi:hypothetical protein
MEKPNISTSQTPPASGVDRREFIVGTAASLALFAGASLTSCSSDSNSSPDVRADGAADRGHGDQTPQGDLPPKGDLPLTQPARVVEVHDPLSVEGSEIKADRVKAMLKAGLLNLAQKEDLQAAWKVLVPDFLPSMRIGIKINCLSSYLYSSGPFLAALVESLITDLGADASRILVWDRFGDELTRSKLPDQIAGAKVLGTVATSKDPSGPGYETKTQMIGAQETRLSRILTEQTDLTINIPLLKTHTISGITGALKNTYGCIDNPGDFHDDLNHQLPLIYSLKPLRERLRLHINEALMAVIKGDTTDPPDTVTARLLLSQDPVALDTHALALVNTLRQPKPAVPAAKLGWLDEAVRLGLGSNKVDLKQVTIT